VGEGFAVDATNLLRRLHLEPARTARARDPLQPVRHILAASRLHRYALVLGAMLSVGLQGCLATQSDIAQVHAELEQSRRANAESAAELSHQIGQLRQIAESLEATLVTVRGGLGQNKDRLGQLERSMQRARMEMDGLQRRLDAVDTYGGQPQKASWEKRSRLMQLLSELHDGPGHDSSHAPLETDAASQTTVDGDGLLPAGCTKRPLAPEVAGRCSLALGRAAVREQRYAEAITIFKSLHDSLGGKPTPVVAEALLELSKIMEVQGKCTNANLILGYVVSDFSRLSQARIAGIERDGLKQRCKEAGGRRGPETVVPVKRALYPVDLPSIAGETTSPPSLHKAKTAGASTKAAAISP
jgi:TolA-binding protein